jgi:hypothetical protein
VTDLGFQGCFSTWLDADLSFCLSSISPSFQHGRQQGHRKNKLKTWQAELQEGCKCWKYMHRSSRIDLYQRLWVPDESLFYLVLSTTPCSMACFNYPFPTPLAFHFWYLYVGWTLSMPYIIHGLTDPYLQSKISLLLLATLINDCRILLTSTS